MNYLHIKGLSIILNLAELKLITYKLRLDKIAAIQKTVSPSTKFTVLRFQSLEFEI